MNTVIEIKVIEKPIVVNDASDNSWKTVPEFNITVKTVDSTLYINRYIPDLYSFDQLVKTHYPKVKIPFPTLTEAISKAEKRKSIRNFFHMSSKSNAEKIEKYLYRCSSELKSSSLLRDFFSPQREGDSVQDRDGSVLVCSSVSPDQLGPSSLSSRRPSFQSDMDTQEPATDNAALWVPSPQLSMTSLPISSHPHDEHEMEQDMEEEEELDDDEEFFNITRSQNSNVTPYFPLDHLEMIKVLGKGCMGKVLLVRSYKTKKLYALKSIIKEHVIDQREITHTLDERNILARISETNFPYLAKLQTSFQDEHRLYLLTNYYCGGDLATHMAKLYNFPPECALFYAAEIIAGIGELHRNGILYRDLKPENILLTGDGHIILTDFGLSKWLDESNDYSTQTFCGTAEYLAPEVLLGESYSFGIDYWSFGTILYEMLAGVTPFWADNHADMYRRVLEDPLEFPADIFDYETAEFLSDVLDRDPRTRLGAQGVEEIMHHVYFADIDWDDIKQRRAPPPYLPPVTDELDFANFDPDFLAMSPVLTPAPSEVEFSSEVQDIFDGYSFVDPEYDEQEQVEGRYNREIQHEDGFYQDDANDEEEEDTASSIYQQPPMFQPARKRGSISMLSNVDSFHLDDERRADTTHPVSTSNEITFKDEELARYAKRRNTAASEEHTHTLVETPHSIKPTLVVMNIQEPTFDELEFSKLPDLRLSFQMDQQEKAAPASTKSTKTNNSSKTRRFFTAFLS